MDSTVETIGIFQNRGVYGWVFPLWPHHTLLCQVFALAPNLCAAIMQKSSLYGKPCYTGYQWKKNTFWRDAWLLLSVVPSIFFLVGLLLFLQKFKGTEQDLVKSIQNNALILHWFLHQVIYWWLIYVHNIAHIIVMTCNKLTNLIMLDILKCWLLPIFLCCPTCCWCG